MALIHGDLEPLLHTLEHTSGGHNGATVLAHGPLAELAKAKTIDEVLKVTELDVTEALDGLPESSIHCSVLAAHTLREAIGAYLSSQGPDSPALYCSTPVATSTEPTS